MSSTSPGEAEYWRGLFKVGGVLMLLTGILAVIDILVSTFVGGLPIGLNLSTERTLQFIEAHRVLYVFDETLLALVSVPLIAVGPILALALYFSIKDVKRSYVYYLVIAVGLNIAGVALSLAAATAPLGLVPLADKYATATSDAQRAVFVTAAEAVNVFDNDFFSILISSLWFLLIGLPMRKSVFDKGAGYLGIVASISGPLAVGISVVSPQNPFFLVYAILLVPWILLVGNKLYRLGKVKAN